jgi:hypothetical protein
MIIANLALVAGLLASGKVAQKCPLQFDGRVVTTASLASFDVSGSPFQTGNVFGKGGFLISFITSLGAQRGDQMGRRGGEVVGRNG